MTTKHLIPLLTFALIFGSVSLAQADTAPIRDTRIVCVTGGVGQQICTTTTVERIASSSAQPAPTATATPSPTPTSTPKATVSPIATVSATASVSGTPAHSVVNTGLQENVVITLIALFIFSSFAFAYSKVS